MIINVKRLNKKEFNKCVKYYLKHIQDEDYLEYKTKRKKEGFEITKKYIEEKRPHWKNRTDFYGENGDEVIAEVIFADVLSNDDVAKLLKKIYGLSDRKYVKDIIYKKPTLFQKYDYVHMSHQGYSVGSFATVKFISDKYIKEIQISWSQINSYYAYLEYRIHFTKCFNEKRYNEFISERIKEINSRKDYVHYYRVSNDKRDNYLMLDQMNDEFFSIICQHYITSLFFSRYGKNYKMINMVAMTREKPINISEMYITDMGVSYYSKEGNYVIVSDLDETDYTLCAGNNMIPSFSLTSYIGRYGNDFYNKLFGNREIKIFENEFSKYISGRKRVKYNTEFIQLFRKIQSLSLAETKSTKEFYDVFNAKWDFYISNDKEKVKEYHKKYHSDLRAIYQSSYEYMKMMTEIDYAKTNKSIAVLAVIISVVAILVSLLTA